MITIYFLSAKPEGGLLFKGVLTGTAHYNLLKIATERFRKSDNIYLKLAAFGKQFLQI